MAIYPLTTPAYTRPLEERHSAISFESEDGTSGCFAYPINYEELYNLKGRLLTLIDATFTDPQQRKAQKDVVWQTLTAWMDDVESSANGHLAPQVPAGSSSVAA